MLALLDADNIPPALVWFDGAVPPGVSPPYALVYFSDLMPEDAESRSLDGRSQRRVTRATVHSVGGNAAASRAVAQRVQQAWLDIAPTVTGRTAFPIRHEAGQDPRRDEGTGGLVQDKVDTYRLETLPA
jgi:hypothetical protein